MKQSKARLARMVPVPALATVAVVAAVLSGPASAHDAEAHAGDPADPHAATAHVGSSVAAHAGHHSASTYTSNTLNGVQLRFHDQMRKLWEDHVTWTRLAIVTFADGSASFGDTASRLLKNQVDIGDAFKPYFGTRIGNHLTALLIDHITIAVEILEAAKDGDAAAFDDAKARWYANSRDIADFLSSLDRKVWPRAEMRSMMKVHLDQTLAEASAELTGHYATSVAAYERIHRHILDMADGLSTGIMRQFPARFGN